MDKKKEYEHVDDFIDYGCMRSNAPKNEKYARWVLNYFRMSAILKNDFREFMKDSLLFCKYEDKVYRVIGASRLGDVWLTSDYSKENGYEHRVSINDCSDWAKSV